MNSKCQDRTGSEVRRMFWKGKKGDGREKAKTGGRICGLRAKALLQEVKTFTLKAFGSEL